MRIGVNLPAQYCVVEGTSEVASPDRLVAAVERQLKAGFQHVELSANFQSLNTGAYDAVTVARLNALREEHGATLSVHLQNGWGVDMDSPVERIRRAAVDETLHLMDRLRPLDIQQYAIHTVWAYIAAHQIVDSRLPGATKEDLLQRIQQQSLKSIRELARHVDRKHLCLENLFVDYKWVAEIVEEVDTSICFDGGHWHLLGGAALDFVERFGPRIALIHCHDVVEGKDHQALGDPPNIDWPGALGHMASLGFDGPVMLELTCYEDMDASLPVLRGMIEGSNPGGDDFASED